MYPGNGARSALRVQHNHHPHSVSPNNRYTQRGPKSDADLSHISRWTERRTAHGWRDWRRWRAERRPPEPALSAFYEWEAAIMNETVYIQGNEAFCLLCEQFATRAIHPGESSLIQHDDVPRSLLLPQAAFYYGFTILIALRNCGRSAPCACWCETAAETETPTDARGRGPDVGWRIFRNANGDGDSSSGSIAAVFARTIAADELKFTSRTQKKRKMHHSILI